MESNKQPIQFTTFTGGMNTDTSDSLLSSNNYREARNMRLTTDAEGNTGALHSIEGCFISSNWSKFMSETLELTGATLLKSTCVRDIGIVMLKNPSAWYIVVFRALNTSGNVDVKYDDLDVLDPLKKPLLIAKSTSVIGESISIVTRHEDEDNIKIYIADGVSLMRIINIANSYKYVNITNSYVPTNYYTGSDSDKKMSVINEITFSKPKFSGFTTGTLPACSVQLCYQLFNKNGSETFVSPASDVIYIYNGVQSNSISSTGGLKGDNTSKAATFTISSIPNNIYTRIKIIAIVYTDNKQIPDIYLMSDNEISSSVFTYTLSDINTHLSKYTIEEFNAINGILFIPSVIETKNNYLFASNVKYIDQAFDVSGYDARAYRFCTEQV